MSHVTGVLGAPVRATNFHARQPAARAAANNEQITPATIAVSYGFFGDQMTSGVSGVSGYDA